MLQELTPLQQVIYGALFHDIGKLFYKAGRQKNHIEAGIDAARQVFELPGTSKCLPRIIQHAIQYHHWKDLAQARPDTLEPTTWLVYEADNIAAGLDRREESELVELEPQNSKQSDFKRRFDPQIPLKSTFSLLSRPKQPTIIDDTDYTQFQGAYRLTMLGKEDKKSHDNIVIPVYPALQQNMNVSKEIYQKVASKWDNEVSANRVSLASNPNVLLVLMESLLSFAPSDNCLERIPDISLFEHLRLTAAIASCMYIHATETSEKDFSKRGHTREADTHRQLDQFLLVAGDISGIQKFIYNITNQGALKSLRARSFYLEVMLEHILDDILVVAGGEHGSLSRANIIYSGGGHFYLLLPNTERVKADLNRVRFQLNQWFWDQFRGSLSFALGWESCTALDLMDPKAPSSGKRQARMKTKWRALSQVLSKQKAQRFACLDDNNFLELFEPDDTTWEGQECVITQVDHHLVNYPLAPGESEKQCNRLAAALHAFGRKLPNAKFLWVRQGVDEQVFAEQFKSQQTMLQSPLLLLPDLLHPGRCAVVQALQGVGPDKDDLPEDEEQKIHGWLLQNQQPGRLYSINRWVLSKFLHANILVGQYYPKQDNLPDMPTFEELANASIGAKKLGVLRADVDNLGELFTGRLPNEVYTFSRIAMLSKQLTLFFKLYINAICEGQLALNQDIEATSLLSSGKKKRSAVIVYAGGDDLFIVGAWNQMLELAIDIRRCFDAFTCSQLTLSAGLQVFDPNTPIKLMAEQTEQAEKKAKNLDGKDALCLFPNPEALDTNTIHSHRDVYPWCEFLTQQADPAFSIPTLISILNHLIHHNVSPKKDDDSQYVLGEAPTSWMTTSLMYQLYHLAQRWSKEGYIALPKLAYVLAQAQARLEQKETARPAFSQAEQFLYNATWLEQDSQSFGQINIRDFKTLFTIISYLTREENA